MTPSKEEFRDTMLRLIAEDKRKKKRQDITNDADVVVPAGTTYSIGVFQRYTSNNAHIKNATKWVVEKVDIEAYEEKIFMGLYD